MDTQNQENPLPDDLPRPTNTIIVMVVLAFLLVLAAMFVIGFVPRRSTMRQAEADAAEMSSGKVRVNVQVPKQAAGAKDVLLPCDVRPNQETAIYPRASGYLKRFGQGNNGKNIDIGDHVEAGQLLAEIDSPEIDAQLAQSNASLEQAKANVARAESDLKLALVTLQRYLETQKTSAGSVTQQEIDQRQAAADNAASAVAQAKANVVAAEANVKQLSVQQGFEKIAAPFAGIITTRNYDVGALLSPNNPAAGKEMFRIAQNDVMRVFVNVPQTYATQVRDGQPANLRVRNYPGRDFVGTVARSTGALDGGTRTMAVELSFPNADASLLAGMYGEVRLGIVADKPALVIPASALVFNAGGTQVVLVRDGKARFQKVVIGRDLGTELEIATGIVATDQVVINPGQQLAEGTDVEAVPTAGAVAGAK